MPTLTERVQVLLSRGQLHELRRLADSRGESIGALIRHAVETAYFEADRQDRIAAVHELAAMNLPVADWEQMERESVKGDQHFDGIPGTTRVDPLQWALQYR